MSKRNIFILFIINLLISAGIISFLFCNFRTNDNLFGSQVSRGTKYVLYIGTNDKDTYTQLIPTDEAKRIVDEICVKYVGGFTALDAVGGYLDDKNVMTHENSLVYEIYDATEQQIKSIMDEVIKALNQSSILVETQKVTYMFYNGN